MLSIAGVKMGCQILKEVAMQSVLIFQRIRNQTYGMPSNLGQVTNNLPFDEIIVLRYV
jgi:hypothetical protein